jgi:hypothetical protein
MNGHMKAPIFKHSLQLLCHYWTQLLKTKKAIHKSFGLTLFGHDAITQKRHIGWGTSIKYAQFG